MMVLKRGNFRMKLEFPSFSMFCLKMKKWSLLSWIVKPASRFHAGLLACILSWLNETAIVICAKSMIMQADLFYTTRHTRKKEVNLWATSFFCSWIKKIIIMHNILCTYLHTYTLFSLSLHLLLCTWHTRDEEDDNNNRRHDIMMMPVKPPTTT